MLPDFYPLFGPLVDACMSREVLTLTFRARHVISPTNGDYVTPLTV